MEKRKAAGTVAAVHDLSCVGRCALTVVIPTLAAMGLQPIPLPTAVLSTHTGGFTEIAARDLSDFMSECIEHWKSLGLQLDAVYSGYLADTAQVNTVRALIDWQRKEHKTLAVVDPVMGDEGALYSAIPKDMPGYMKQLCDEADLVTPNLTEASLMLNVPYSEAPMSCAQAYDLLKGFGARHTVITSIALEGHGYVNIYRQQGEKGFWIYPYNRIPKHYPGTGDLFASVLTGGLTKGDDMHEAIAQATDFLCRVIAQSSEVDSELRLGVQLEPALKYLMEPVESAIRPEFIEMDE